jgi:hypothetical protein
MTRLHPLVAGSILACAALILASCATSSIDGSRHQLYDSVDALSSDSSAIVVGSVGTQEIVDADIPFTVSTLTIERTFSTPTLGGNLDGAVEPLSPGMTIKVRQIGSTDIGSIPAPILSSGGTYLLFLTPTMLPSDRSGTDFYITGGSAGMYASDGPNFARVDPDSGDSLPSKLTLSDFE